MLYQNKINPIKYKNENYEPNEFTKGLIKSWDLTKSLKDTLSSSTIVSSTAEWIKGTGIRVNSATEWFLVSCGKVDSNYKLKVEIDIGDISYQTTSSHGRFIILGNKPDSGFILRNASGEKSWQFYDQNGWNQNTLGSNPVGDELFENCTLGFEVGNGYFEVYKDNVKLARYTLIKSTLDNFGSIMIGSVSGQGYNIVDIKAIRVYKN